MKQYIKNTGNTCSNKEKQSEFDLYQVFDHTVTGII